MADLHQQIYTTKTVVHSFKVTLKTPPHIWPLCFACGKFLWNPSELCLPPHLRVPSPPCHHLPVLSLEVWETRRSSASSTFPPSRVWKTDNECFPLCLLLLSSFISQDSLQQTKGRWFIPTASSPTFFLLLLRLCLYLCRRTSSHHLCSQRAGRRIKVRRGIHLIDSKQAGVFKQCFDTSP